MINTVGEYTMGFIYKTTNHKNGKIYIGKSKKNDPKYLGSGKILKQAIDKYGRESFSKEILEECLDDIIDDREKFWISQLNSSQRQIGYNLTIGGTGGDTTSLHPDKERIVEVRKKGITEWHNSMSDADKQTYAEKISKAKTGRSNGRNGHKHDQETIEKIKNNQPPKTEQWRQAFDEAMKKRKGVPLTKKYKQVVVNGVSYDSVKEAVEGLGLKHAKYFYDMKKQGKITVEYL